MHKFSVIATTSTIITGNTITINNAKASNAGSYICLAQNAFEKDEASTSVSVIGKYISWLQYFLLKVD
jgi:hypothetical protein